jgi:hypothetical protein
VILVIWFPLFLLSTANPTLEPNPIQSCSTEIAITGWTPFYAATVDHDIQPYASDEQVGH